MKQSIKPLFFLFALASLAFLIPPGKADAAWQATPSVKYLGQATSARTFKNIDVTHDGKADKVKIKVSKNPYEDGASVYVNGRKALSVPAGDFIDSTCVYAYYIYQTDSREFLMLRTDGMNDVTGTLKLYRYDSGTKKLKLVKGFCEIPSYTAEVTGVTKNSVTITYREQFAETGYIEYAYSYKYSGGKMKRTNKTTSVKSTAASSYYGTQPEYAENFKKNLFTVSAPSLSFYKKPGSSAKAFMARRGSTVELKNVYCSSSGKYYLQFSYSGKTGWKRVGKLGFVQIYKHYDDSLYDGVRPDGIAHGWFYEVENTLVG